RMQGFSTIGQFTGGPDVLGGAVWLDDKKLELLDLILSALPNGMRVINYSGGVASFIGGDGNLIKDSSGRPISWNNFPNKTCGPGPNDDEPPTTSPGSKFDCTPDNEDGWLREIDQVGRSATRIARLASQQNVAIVQAAGNNSWNFCNPERNDCY